MFACAASVVLFASCATDDGLRIVPAEGSWRALEAVSDEAAWFASSTGHWQQMTTDGLRLESHAYADTLSAPADSAVSLHYRGWP